MSEQNHTSQVSSQIPAKRNRTLMWASLLVILVAALFLWNPFGIGGNDAAKEEPILQRDESTQEQILQPDFRQKIEEMIDSGRTVAEISKETGIRRDMVRKIKKEMGKAGD